MSETGKTAPKPGSPKTTDKPPAPKTDARPATPKAARLQPAIKTPEPAHRVTHGPQTGERAATRGAPRLARLLKLSKAVPIDRLCDEAADALEAMVDPTPAEPWDDTD